MPDDEGFIFRVPKEVLPAIGEISDRTGLKPSQIARALLVHAVNNPPQWMRDAVAEAAQPAEVA